MEGEGDLDQTVWLPRTCSTSPVYTDLSCQNSCIHDKGPSPSSHLQVTENSTNDYTAKFLTCQTEEWTERSNVFQIIVFVL